MNLKPFLVVGFLAVTAAGSCSTDPAAPDTCTTGLTLTVGTVVSGEVTRGDCVIQDHRGDSYTFTLANQTTIKFNVNASSPLDIQITDTTKAASNQEILVEGNDLTSFATYAVLPAGTYRLDIGSVDGSSPYTIVTAALTPPQPTNCIMTSVQHFYATPGVDVAGTITATDCPGASTYYNDAYVVRMPAGQLRKITVTSSAGQSIEIHDFETGALATFKALNTAGTNVLQWVPGGTKYYVVSLIGAPGTGSITYDIKIE